MPRQGRSGGAASGGRRPVVPSKPAPLPRQQQQTRPATSAAYPPANTTAAPPAPQPTASAGPGLFGQMASTAAGVAVGSSIGHAVGGFFGGGSSQPAAAQDNGAVAAQSQDQNGSNWGARSCEADAKQFTKCLDDNQGNMQICSWYLEQLKACQSAASQY